MAESKYYVICNSGCRFESMTKEQILTAITQAVNEGTIGDINTGFVTTIKTVNGRALKFFVGSQSEYEVLTDDEKKNLFAVITNDTNKESLFSAIEEIRAQLDAQETRLADGSVVAGKAESLTAEQSQIEVAAGDAFEYNFDTDCLYIVEVSIADGATVALFVKCSAIDDFVHANSSCAIAMVGTEDYSPVFRYILLPMNFVFAVAVLDCPVGPESFE